MFGLILVILLIVCVAAVFAALGYLAWRGVHLGKSAIRVGRDVRMAVERLAPGIATLQGKAGALAEDQARLTASLAHLQESLTRLGTVGGLFAEALAPLLYARSFFRR